MVKGAQSQTARRSHVRPPGGIPTLAKMTKMVRQLGGRPRRLVSSAYMLSKAGTLHNDLKASQADDTREHATLAGANLQ